MPGNQNPIFSKIGATGSVYVTAGNARSDGTGTVGTNMFLAFTSDATNGSYVQRIRFTPISSSVGTSTTATVGRVFLSNVASGTTSNTNTYLFQEVVLPSVSAANASNATVAVEVPLNFALPAGATILVSTHASPVTNTAWVAQVIGGNY